ncbi:acyl-CoA dehydrogenase family protein [Janibacter alittae]|uniref:Acyl-CoA dehydrogenase family protein n=1 Tax=Janibacter alittae TaxID=3115209 RepID=A0ABZ2MG29_9MICO
MKIAFEPEQHDLAAGFDRAAAAVASPQVARGLWDTETGRSADLWRAVAEMGLTAIVVPGQNEGFGGTLVDLALVLERIGHHAVPDALLEALVTGPVAIARAGSSKQQEAWLPGIADGSIRATAALRGLTSVPDAHVSDVLVYREGESLHLADLSRCALTPLVSMDPSRRQFAVEVPPEAAEPLPGSAAALEAVLAHEASGSASVLIGLAQRMIDYTVDYVQVREQFGRVIGSFQAVKHQLADATARIVLARFQVHAAAAKVAAGAEDARHASLAARRVALDAEFEANRAALQLHGGIGFTWEHDLQIWLKRGKALEQAHGNRGEVADELGAAVLATL